jgi:hypothetical protein
MNNDKQLVKRQSTSDSLCKLVLGGLQPAKQLLCCEDNSPCLASPPICTSTNKMARCWFINQLPACYRNDTLAQTVCKYKNGVYCLKGVTDLSYDISELSGWNVIDVILSRATELTVLPIIHHHQPENPHAAALHAPAEHPRAVHAPANQHPKAALHAPADQPQHLHLIKENPNFTIQNL